jgi:hypothetical protein
MVRNVIHRRLVGKDLEVNWEELEIKYHNCTENNKIKQNVLM